MHSCGIWPAESTVLVLTSPNANLLVHIPCVGVSNHLQQQRVWHISMFAEQSGSNALTLLKLLSPANWSACKQSGHAELRCTMVATIALHAASLVSFCIAYLQLPLTIMSLDKWVQE